MSKKEVSVVPEYATRIQHLEGYILKALGRQKGEQLLKGIRREHNKSLNTNFGKAHFALNAAGDALKSQEKVLQKHARKFGWRPAGEPGKLPTRGR